MARRTCRRSWPTRPTCRRRSRRRSATTCCPSPTRRCATRIACSTRTGRDQRQPRRRRLRQRHAGCSTTAAPLARSLGFDTVIAHTRDAMWRVDDLIAVLAIGTSMISNQSKLAEDLEICSSSEFDFVDLDDGYSRSSVLMPQKRNPYALSIVRGAVGRADRPADRLPRRHQEPVRAQRQLHLRLRRGAPRAGSRAAGHPADDRRGAHAAGQPGPDARRALDDGYAQATDLAEHLTQTCGVDYRTAYLVVGDVVREASAAGHRGARPHGADAQRRPRWSAPGGRWAGSTATCPAVLDPRQIVAVRHGARRRGARRRRADAAGRRRRRRRRGDRRGAARRLRRRRGRRCAGARPVARRRPAADDRRPEEEPP